MSLGKAYLEDVTVSYRQLKEMAEKAFRQVDSDDDFFRKPAEFSNSIAMNTGACSNSCPIPALAPPK